MTETPSTMGPSKSLDESPEGTILRLVGGYRVTQALYVVTKLGVPDLLSGGPEPAETLADRIGVNPDRLGRVMRALASVGVFSRDPEGRFGLTEAGKLLRTQADGSMAPVATFAGEEPYRAWGDLIHSVRTGQTAFDHVFGMGHFDYLSSHPDAAATFNRLMAWSIGVGGEPLKGHDLSHYKVLVDVGGGKGALIASALRANPGLRGILFDQAAAVVEAPALLGTHGVSDRCEIITGSAFEAVPPGGDVYVMSRVLHDWPDDKAAQLLTNCRRAMAKGNSLLLVEGVLPDGDAPMPRLWLDLVMMVMTGGRERTEAEWRVLLERTGFSLTSVRPTRPNQDLIQARAV
jgi:O-methyltransferase/methyltransferase family protein